jgi:hypothetical protein
MDIIGTWAKPARQVEVDAEVDAKFDVKFAQTPRWRHARGIKWSDLYYRLGSGGVTLIAFKSPVSSQQSVRHSLMIRRWPGITPLVL